MPWRGPAAIGIDQPTASGRKRLHDTNIRHSPEAVSALLAGPFVEIGSSGRLFSRSEIIAELQNEPLHIEAADFVAGELNLTVIKLNDKASIGGINSLRESIWLRTDDGWKVVFHRAPQCPEC